ncbi:MAG: L-histidine N(alpha)-methyltransferase [Acidobacteriia bacterium]|nr:L-histidine N(alpha)-methyltransferase [Terriglobia bacterium]
MLTHEVTTISTTDFAEDVRVGLERDGQKELLPKYFYDDVGFALFEVISQLPEYGLTRADERLLCRYAAEMIDGFPSPVVVAELGSGSGKKTRWILEALCRRQPTSYFPIEISASALARCQQELADLESVRIEGLPREYLDGLLEVAARRRPDQRLLVLFLGSTIGNFDRSAGERFLKEIRDILEPGDGLLLGTDLEKPVDRLLLAYDDPLGVTAAFNLNLLARINRELNANFDLTQFEHFVRYNYPERRVEMHLRSTTDQRVRIPGADLTVRLRKDETIWTESSHKFTTREVAEIARRTGFHCTAQWVDKEWPFAESLLLAG